MLKLLLNIGEFTQYQYDTSNNLKEEMFNDDMMPIFHEYDVKFNDEKNYPCLVRANGPKLSRYMTCLQYFHWHYDLAALGLQIIQKEQVADKFTPMSFEEFQNTEFATGLNKYHGFVLANTYWDYFADEGETSLETVAGIKAEDAQEVMYQKYVNYLVKLKAATV